MSDPRITRTESPAVRPGAPTIVRPSTPEEAARMSADQATWSVPAVSTIAADPDARQALDKNGWWASIQSFLQGATRTGALAGRALVRARAFTAIADVLDGNGATIARGVARATEATSGFLGRVVPRAAGPAMKVLAPAIKGGGFVLKAVGKATPIFSVAAAGWDTYKASSERDPAKRNQAWANAGISIGGTAATIGAIAIGATPVGWALGIGAAALAGFQLVDNLGFGGRGTKAIGDGAKRVWDALT
jgi:hypothetical protein